MWAIGARGPGTVGRFAGSVRIPPASRCSSMRRQAATRYPPFGVVQCRCSQTVFASSLRLSDPHCSTISWMAAIRRRVRRRPENVVDLRLLIRGSIGLAPVGGPARAKDAAGG